MAELQTCQSVKPLDLNLRPSLNTSSSSKRPKRKEKLNKSTGVHAENDTHTLNSVSVATQSPGPVSTASIAVQSPEAGTRCAAGTQCNIPGSGVAVGTQTTSPPDCSFSCGTCCRTVPPLFTSLKPPTPNLPTSS